MKNVINNGKRKIIVATLVLTTTLFYNIMPAFAALSFDSGEEELVNNASTTYTAVAALDSTHFVAAYAESGAGNAVIGTVSATDTITIDSGEEKTFNAATTTDIAVAAIDSTHFVVVYSDAGDSNYGKAVIGTVSAGDTITFGSEYGFDNTLGASYIDVATLDSTHIVVSFRMGFSPFSGVAIVGTVSGSTITFDGGEATVFNTGSTAYTTIAALDSTHFVVGYRDQVASPFPGSTVVGVVSAGDTITIDSGEEELFNNASTTYIDVAALDSTHFVLVYRDEFAAPQPGSSIVGVVSAGDTITYDSGEEELINNASTNYLSVTALDSATFAVVYQDGGDSNACNAVIGDVTAGDTIAYNTEATCNPDTSLYMSTSALDSSSFVTFYRDEGAAPQPGSAIIGVDAAAGGGVPEFKDYILMVTIVLALGLMIKLVPKIKSGMRPA